MQNEQVFEEPYDTAISEETKQWSSSMPLNQGDDIAARDAPSCADCVKSEAKLIQCTALADELMKQLEQCQEKLRLEQVRSDKLMQRVIRLETEQRGQIQPELDQKLDQKKVQAESTGQVESSKDELDAPLQKRKKKRNKKAGKKVDVDEIDSFLDAIVASKD